MAVQSEKITAGYERLSKDDLLAGESMSIQNQKTIIEAYAARHGFANIRHFLDDGVTGTVFRRPGLDAMLEEIKAGNVATVIIKDAYVKHTTTNFLISYVKIRAVSHIDFVHNDESFVLSSKTQ